MIYTGEEELEAASEVEELEDKFGQKTRPIPGFLEHKQSCSSIWKWEELGRRKTYPKPVRHLRKEKKECYRLIFFLKTKGKKRMRKVSGLCPAFKPRQHMT